MKHYAMVMESSFAEAAGLACSDPKQVEPSGSIFDAPEPSRVKISRDKPLILLGLSLESQEKLGWEEWARREPHRREYIGKNEADGSVVLRVVLSDSVPSDPERLVEAIKVRIESVVAQLAERCKQNKTTT